MVRRAVVAAGALTLAVAAANWFAMPHYRADGETARRLARAERELSALWKGLLLRDTGLAGGSSASTIDAAFAARNLVYSRTIIGQGRFDSEDAVTAYLKLSAGETRMLCDGMADAYRFLLSKLGVRSRLVQLAAAGYLEGGRRLDTHVSVEVFDEAAGRWFVSDPTFNVSWRCEGERRLASHQELRDCHAQGRTLQPDSNGQPLIAGRRIQDYYLSYGELLHGMRVYDESGPGVTTDLPHAGWLEEAESRY